MIVMILLSNFIFTIDLGLFAFWEVKINHKIFFYLSNPREAIVSTLSVPYARLFLFFILLSASFIVIYRYLIHINQYKTNSLISRIFFILAFAGLSIAGLRGGIQDIPLGKHQIYYSEHPVFNQAALNSFWNCMDELVSAGQYENISYDFFPDHEASGIFNTLMTVPKDTMSGLFRKFEAHSWLTFGSGALGNRDWVCRNLYPGYSLDRGAFHHFLCSETRRIGLYQFSKFPARQNSS